MDFNIKVGMKAEIELTVEHQHSAVAFGSGEVDVFATPMMIALMEKAALTAVDRHLGEGYATVGTMISAKHLTATPIGMRVRAVAELTSIEGKRLTFKVEAFDEKKKIGEGMHERYIVEFSKFVQRASEKGLK